MGTVKLRKIKLENDKLVNERVKANLAWKRFNFDGLLF